MNLPILRKKEESNKEVDMFNRDIMPLRRAMNQLFEESFWSPFQRSGEWLMPSLDIKEWVPRADISETDTAISIKLNVPDVDPTKIKVSLDKDVLTVSGHTEKEQEEKGKDYYRLERERGEFSRSFTLPDSVDSQNIQALAENGTLMITLAKKPESKKETTAQTIEVKTKS